jgi:hypothetical protein
MTVAGAAGPSLSALLRAGDPDALAGFRDAHTGQVRSFCEVVCAADRVEEAIGATFVELVARLRTTTVGEVALDEVLLASTRSVTAGRFEVRPPVAGPERPAPEPGCAAMPELLAAAANGELMRPAALHENLTTCGVCAESAERLGEAERQFAQTPAIPS